MKSQNSRDSLVYYLQYFFSRYLKNQRGLSENTIANYKQTWKLFWSFLLKEKKIASETTPRLTDISLAELFAFLEYLEDRSLGRGNKISTRNNRLAAIKAFFHAVQLIDPQHQMLCDQVMAIPVKKKRKPIVDYLEKEELDLIFSSIDTKHSEGFRDVTMLRLLYNTGARASEIANLRCSDLDFLHEKQVRIVGKGEKERICPLWDSTIAFLSIYLKSERKKPKKGYEDYLFINQRAKPFTRFGIGRIIMKYFKKAKKSSPPLAKKHITAHAFRHSTAVHMLQSGVDVNVICDWLGHANISTTCDYLHIDLKMKRSALKKFNWLERILKSDLQLEELDWKDIDQVSKWLDKL